MDGWLRLVGWSLGVYKAVLGHFFELQMMLTKNVAAYVPFSLSGFPALESALVFLIAAIAVKNDKAKLLLIFSCISAVFVYMQYSYWVLYYITCSNSECVSWFSTFSAIRFQWMELASEIGGYCIASFAIFAWNKANLKPFLAWLEFDTVAYRRYWQAWLNLPLWSYAKTIKNGALKVVPAFCCVAAVCSAALLAQLMFTPFWQYFGLENGDDTAEYELLILILAALPFLILNFWIAFAGGRIAYEIGYRLSLANVFLVTVLIEILEVISISSMYFLMRGSLGEAAESASDQLFAFIPLILGWILIAVGIVLGNRAANRTALD